MDRRSLIFVLGLTIALFFVNQWFSSSNPPQKSTPPPKQVETIKEEISFKETPETPAVPQSANEEFFVLENDYQQIVFSNVGGSIAEINLPFQSKQNTKSVVRPINFDRAFKEQYSFDDHYPSFPYYINRGDGVKKIDERSLGGYYPLLRRALFSPRSDVTATIPSRHYALKVTSESSDLHRKIFSLKRLEKNLIEFECVDSDRKINKIFTFPKNPDDAPYCLEAAIKIDGDARGLWLTTGGVPEVELISDNPAPALTYRITKSNNKSAVESISLPKECIASSSLYPDWVCSSNGFFGLILDPLTEVPPGYRACRIAGTEDPSRLTLVDPEYRPYPAEKYPGYEFQIPLRSQTLQLRYLQGLFKEISLKKSMPLIPILKQATTPNTLAPLASKDGLHLFLSHLLSFSSS